MSEVKRYYVGKYGLVEGQALGRLGVVLSADFDRVNAERDALRNEIGQVKGEYDRAVNKVDALQSRLTAADERADVLEGLLLQTNELLYAIQGDPGAVPSSSIDAMRGEVFTTLKPEEPQRNQCDGCQAGYPVVNGAHRMGKPVGYPDTMSCTAKLYKPAEGGGDDKRKADFIRLNSAPHCPECGHPDCNGQCFGDDMMGD